VGLAGIEPATSSLSGMRSNRLSYSPADLLRLSVRGRIPQPAGVIWLASSGWRHVAGVMWMGSSGWCHLDDVIQVAPTDQVAQGLRPVHGAPPNAESHAR
jgi:hypothetical protein